ncbi:hypothetical protein FRX31_003686 [Thalictrum thalictroides]|uniref:Uncharacterized protein n=1 Tax=Thalictrum thalictroides TaxID=46969 RepID=A0A7J6XCL7_THATH|nr:hypothetical protein FRX31_003686 [Thalictrum thalictroides]
MEPKVSKILDHPGHLVIKNNRDVDWIELPNHLISLIAEKFGDDWFCQGSSHGWLCDDDDVEKKRCLVLHSSTTSMFKVKFLKVMDERGFSGDATTASMHDVELVMLELQR